ncbi:energy transducer TonB [Roseovarius aestuarii]|nr:energy transducer TonB [Roseovarius aestuarii]
MNTGNIISGIGHVALIGWALAGPLFRPTPKPFEVTQVTAVSEEEYAAIMNAQRPNDAPTQEVQQPEIQPTVQPDIAAPVVPDAPQESPALDSQADTAPQQQPAPETAQPAAPDATPVPVAPAPETQAQDTTPVLEPPAQDMAALIPQTSLRPKQRPVQRIAPEQVAPPEPDTAVDDVVRQEAAPAESADTPVEEQEATAPEEAATEIVTEAEEAAPVTPSPPTKSVRPKTRPTRTAAAPETQAAPSTPEPDADTGTASGIEDALAAALGGATSEPAQTSAPSGPPLTGGEKDALRLAVQSCWNTGSLSSDALKVTVTVAFDMAENAKPKTETIRLIDSAGGTSGAAQQAYEAARRAIIRCGARGFNLPVEKYASWKTVEMVFNPERMRIK